MKKIVLLLAFMAAPIVASAQRTDTLPESKIVRWDHYYKPSDPRWLDAEIYDDSLRFSPEEKYQMQYKTVRVPSLAPAFKYKWDNEGFYITNGGLADA